MTTQKGVQQLENEKLELKAARPFCQIWAAGAPKRGPAT